jgi:hypothetical protein
MRHRTKEGSATVPVAQLQSFARQRATMGGSILCLARAIRAIGDVLPLHFPVLRLA